MSTTCSPSHSTVTSTFHVSTTDVNGVISLGDSQHHVPDSIFNDEPMFPPSLITRTESSDGTSKSSPATSNSSQVTSDSSGLSLGGGLFLRPLNTMDFHRGFVHLLSQLTDVGEVTDEMFLSRYRCMKACPNTYFIIVIHDTNTDHTAATGTLVIEQKFIRQCATRGRIEDIVVSDEYRGSKLGIKVVDTLRDLGRHLGCYKSSLECKDALIPFYEKVGFKRDEGNNYCIERYSQY